MKLQGGQTVPLLPPTKGTLHQGGQKQFKAVTFLSIELGRGGAIPGDPGGAGLGRRRGCSTCGRQRRGCWGQAGWGPWGGHSLAR